MRIWGGEGEQDVRRCSGSSCGSSRVSVVGMFVDGDSVECDDELKRKSVMEPTFEDRHETVVVVGDFRPF